MPSPLETAAIVAFLLLYFVCLVFAVATRKRPWRMRLYGLAMMPALVSVIRNGLGMDTLLTAGIFAALTALLLYAGAKEWGDG